MNEVPRTRVSLMWLLSNIGMPMSIAMVLGMRLHSIMRCLMGILATGAVLVCVLTLAGVIALDETQLAQLTRILVSCAIRLFALTTKAASRFPAATIGLMLGMLLREFRPSKAGAVSK